MWGNITGERKKMLFFIFLPISLNHADASCRVAFFLFFSSCSREMLDLQAWNLE